MDEGAEELVVLKLAKWLCLVKHAVFSMDGT